MENPIEMILNGWSPGVPPWLRKPRHSSGLFVVQDHLQHIVVQDVAVLPLRLPGR